MTRLIRCFSPGAVLFFLYPLPPSVVSRRGLGSCLPIYEFHFVLSGPCPPLFYAFQYYFRVRSTVFCCQKKYMWLLWHVVVRFTLRFPPAQTTRCWIVRPFACCAPPKLGSLFFVSVLCGPCPGSTFLSLGERVPDGAGDF